MTRARPEWPSLQATLPTPRPSAWDPLRPSLSDAERLEWWLLSLSDEAWERISAPRAIISEHGPSTTGDAVVDEWEREFWAKHGGK